MGTSLSINKDLIIDEAEFTVSFARSPGPGGQNVNKVNSKAIVHWAIFASSTLPAPVMHRMAQKFGNRINNDGELVVSSHTHRGQAQNLEECYEKIRAMVLESLHPPTRRKRTIVPRAAVRKRLSNKRQTSEKKQSRRQSDWE